jgi:GrpB-like predicted nucleotidyltransferase (UPF0157 family)
VADAPVLIAQYDPAWLAGFDAEAGRVVAVLGPWLAAPVEHIGSTSVPGLPAKPIVDMLAPVKSLSQAQDAAAPLQAGGWVFWPEDPCRHYRLWFLRPSPEARTHHLHVIEHSHPQARALIAFRDALRADPELRAEYAGLKRQLAREHSGNRNAYTNAKAGFVARVVSAAGIELPARGRLPE